MELIVIDSPLEIKDLRKVHNNFTVLSVTIGQECLKHFWGEFRTIRWTKLSPTVNFITLHYLGMG